MTHLRAGASAGKQHGVAIGDIRSRFGAEGNGISIYLTDPEGNTVELKGPSDGRDPPPPRRSEKRGQVAEQCAAKYEREQEGSDFSQFRRLGWSVNGCSAGLVETPICSRSVAQSAVIGASAFVHGPPSGARVFLQPQ
jgi:hypothetical protein